VLSAIGGRQERRLLDTLDELSSSDAFEGARVRIAVIISSGMRNRRFEDGSVATT
jgi:hypothetical protein